MKIQSLATSKIFLVVVIVLAELIVLLGVFRLGMVIGFRKATFSYRWGENYHQLFGGPRHGWGGEFGHDDYINSNSVVGSVLQANTSTLTVRGSNNVETSVVVTPTTVIQKNRQSINVADIQTNDQVVILGTPSSSGQVEAKFIRIINTR